MIYICMHILIDVKCGKKNNFGKHEANWSSLLFCKGCSSINTISCFKYRHLLVLPGNSEKTRPFWRSLVVLPFSYHPQPPPKKRKQRAPRWSRSESGFRGKGWMNCVFLWKFSCKLKPGDGFRHLLLSPRSMWKWSNLMSIFFQMGGVQPPPRPSQIFSAFSLEASLQLRKTYHEVVDHGWCNSLSDFKKQTNKKRSMHLENVRLYMALHWTVVSENRSHHRRIG